MADQNSTLTQELLHQLFEYKDGELYWKISLTNNVKVGQLAGSISGDGRLKTGINGKRYKNHRLIFLYHYGFLPKIVDHVDGNPLNNKIENLRAATQQQNIYNSKLSSRNTSGCKNVFFEKRKNVWKVVISVNGKNKYIGSYKDLELADLVATEARDKYHGKFANHG